MAEYEIRYDVFLKGEHIDLVVLTEEIAEKSNWYNWFNDEENMRNMQKHYFPNNREEQIMFFKTSILGNPKKLQLGILHKEERKMIGVISLDGIDHLNKKCGINGVIGETKYKSIHYWLEANRLLIHHAINSLNMRKIYGGSLSKELSIFYERMLGFESEGVLKQDVYKNGRFQDVYLFAFFVKDK